FSRFLAKYDFGKLQFVVGCGFEARTNAIMSWMANSSDAKIECTIVDLLNDRDPNYEGAKKLQKENVRQMKGFASRRRWRARTIKSDLYSTRSIAHIPLLETLKSILRRFSGDFLFDISSLPRSIVLPALKMLWKQARVRNLLIAYTEDPTVGALEKQAKDFREPSYLPFFMPTR